ncbi:hypothetical protein MBAV_003274 [Candidatus Magnetobacterium bavaricum]|uniref:Uncharacterized protein n=1 Tax=Candidatus Magnetobacterium bavaricum TaxID=29290 RepID=A0A0F3GRE7_9BACT|nr:hypothetical protein MBAV_003274 [Candidatus Magnetobacterium bavaricum]
MHVETSSPEFVNVVKQIALQVLRDALTETPPKSEISLLLYAHVKDMQSFRDSVQSRLSGIEHEMVEVKERLTNVETTMVEVKERLTNVETTIVEVKERLTNVETTMMTKEYWDSEKLRLLEGIGIKFMEVLSAQKGDTSS